MESSSTEPLNGQHCQVNTTVMPTDSAHQLRALLPNPKSKPVPLLSPESASRTQLASKRRSVAIACESCRKRKTRCDGQRPCSSCSAHTRPGGLVNCEYKDPQCEINSLKRACDELKRQNEALGDVIDVLRSRPEEQALEIFRLLRAGADASEIFATSTTTSFSFSCL
ncbi:Nitrogen assimilation transcription factor nirA [Cytospora mali]|uniref:Nitrogen assimilation transcription factor nirA n=1 Tax=Cytospora mali TaxID=578113 RepID=A0A194VLP8_CYTMA|nr:Nitrogen assimilation transcription factor nirA [Valsa mali]